MSLYHELKRRNVFRVAIAYLALAWLVTEVASTLFPTFGIPDWGVRFLVIVFALGFLPALIISWVYELTPEGIKREKDVVRDASITYLTAKRLDLFTIGLIVVALAFILADRFWISPRLAEQSAVSREVATDTVQIPEPQPLESQFPHNSIAVLPFVNMSDDASNEFFSEGISEELLNLLTKIPELSVISRSSAFSYKGKDINLSQVAQELSVAHILEGSVRKAGDRVRIRAQLIETRSDTHLWSETYDRNLDDIFAIQDDIAASVVEQLKVTLLGAVPQVEEIDPRAYALYLQALYLGRQNTSKSLEQSIALYEQVLDMAPGYTPAWRGLSVNYINQTSRGLRPLDEGHNLARQAIEMALTIDPDSGQAKAVLGYITMTYDGDLAAAARHLERALQLEPTDLPVINGAAGLLQNLGRIEPAIALRAYMAGRDPVVAISHANLGNSFFLAGLWDEAIASIYTVLRLSPDYVGAQYYLGRALLFKGEAEAALAAFGREKGDEEYRVKGEAMALYALGRHNEYQARLDELISRWGDQWPSEVAHVYAFVGDADSAFRWLDKAVAQNEPGLINQFLQPFYRPIQSDPRWQSFLEATGQSSEQLAAIEFEVTLPQ
jgi:TolB-like protein